MGRLIALASAAGAGLLAAAVLAWVAVAPPSAPPVTPAPAAAEALDDLLRDLQIVPLGGRPAPSFSVATLDGRRLGLADLQGRAALLYFWATW